jgi:hypothetical protein
MVAFVVLVCNVVDELVVTADGEKGTSSSSSS